MNEAMIKMLVGAIGIKPEQLQAVIQVAATAKKALEDNNAFLQENIELQRKIIELLKKRG